MRYMNETGAPARADWLDALTTTATVSGRRYPGSLCQPHLAVRPGRGPQAMMSSLPQFRSELLEPT